jgi:hypothetical protein
MVALTVAAVDAVVSWSMPRRALLALLIVPAAVHAAPARGALGISTCTDLDHVPAGSGATFFVRPDGGDAGQCTGRANAPYPGSGHDQPCAFLHPFIALPPGGRARVGAGDTLVIGPGHYRMGLGAPGAEACEAEGSFDCVMAPLPSGKDAAHPTRLVGARDARGALPELWGAERAWFVVNLKGTSDAEVSCLEITDHSPCVEFHSGDLRCQRDQPPYGDWAASGVLAVDSRRVTLRSLDIHGLASAGVTAGRLSDWLVEDVFITANGLVGWQGDLGEPSANHGDLTFRRVAIDWNGCGESVGKREPIGCWSQEAGGYGDGLGTAATGGNWTFEDSRFVSNTSDGLDLLYHNGDGRIRLTRVWAEGNAGNQLKARGEVSIDHAVAVGSCAAFRGKPWSWKVDDCRAAGNAIALEPMAGRPIRIDHTTVTGQGDALLELVVPVAEAGDALRASVPRDVCKRLAPVTIRASIWRGGKNAANGEPTALFYKECGGIEGAGPVIDHQGGVVWGVKDYGFGEGGACPEGSGNRCADPKLDATTLRPVAGGPGTGRGAL